DAVLAPAVRVRAGEDDHGEAPDERACAAARAGRPVSGWSIPLGTTVGKEKWQLCQSGLPCTLSGQLFSNCPMAMARWQEGSAMGTTGAERTRIIIDTEDVVRRAVHLRRIKMPAGASVSDVVNGVLREALAKEIQEVGDFIRQSGAAGRKAD